ncbi:TTC14 family protein [Megaselia abdita]
MNKQLIANSLCYHGQPLLKIWEGERGSELENIGIVNPDFSVYNFRQKNLTFQDRAKRLKLHQFLAKNAEDLFCINVIGSSVKKKWSYDTNENSNNPVSFSMPPFECFIKKEVERSKYVHSTLSTLNKGDLVYCVVTSKTSAGIFVKPLCTGNQTLRILEDLNLKSFIPTQNLVKLDRKGNELTYAVQDYITCDVIDVSADAERITLGMLYDEKLHKTSPFGIIAPNNLPEYYKKSMSHPQSMYHEFLQQDKNFKNSESFESIGEELGIDSNELFTNIKSLKIPFPAQEYASDLRQAQASKWAFRSVADGIEHFKEGRHTEAFQCLNKALSIDPRNVEGLVARGALYANSSNFHKAINDFETSLKLNFYHINARKYLSETLVALGRSYEDENNFEEALKAYQNCLNISPNHEEAKNSLENLKVRFDLAIVESKRDIPKMKMETLGSKKANDLKGEVGKQPYYLSILENDKSDYDKKVQSFIDVAKDDDDYESRVRKLLLEASKYQKERQKTSSSSSSNYKEKEKKKKKKSKKESKKPKEYDIGNAQLAEALK